MSSDPNSGILAKPAFFPGCRPPRAEGFHTYVATDADDHAANLTGWNQVYDQLTPGKFRGSISELWMGKLQVFREATSHTVRQACQAWPESWWFGIPTDDEGTGRFGSFCIEKDSIAVRSGNADFELLTPDNFEILGVVVEQRELADYVLATEHVSLTSSIFSQNLLHIGGAQKRSLQTLLQQVLTEVSSSPYLLSHPAVRLSIRSSILQALSDVCCSRMNLGKPSSTQANHHSLVFRIREYVLSRRDEPVTVSDLCRDFYVSRRTLQNAFHNVVGMSPVSYLRAVRLNGVRRMLRDSGSRFISVQDAAAEWGFWHLSQFACDYKKLFGELPSESLRQHSAQRLNS